MQNMVVATFTMLLASALSASDGVAQLDSVRSRMPPSTEVLLTQHEIEATSAATGCLPHGVRAPIAAFGVHDGGRMIALSPGGDRRHMSVVSILGDRRGPDRILLLMAYNSVVWDFTHAPLDRIRGVIVSGYHSHAVANLPRHIPVAFSSRDGGAESCGGPGYAAGGGPDLDRAAAAAERAVGARVVSFAGAEAASAVMFGDDLQPSDAAPSVDNGALRAAVTLTRRHTPLRMSGRGRLQAHGAGPWINNPEQPEPPALVALQAQGVIRAATDADVQTWNESVTARLRTGALAPYQSSSLRTYLRLNRVYVVRAPMNAPPEMFGGHSRHFIVERGVPAPSDPSSHSTYYFVDDGTCRGPGSECREIDDARIMTTADVRFHCAVVAQNQIALQPVGEGPARLEEVFCHRPPTSPYSQSGLLVSPDGERVARVFYPGEIRTATLTPASEWTAWSDVIARGDLLNANASVRWDRSGRTMWAALQDRAERGGWAAAPMRIARVSEGGGAREVRIAGAPGRLDAVRWVADGLLLAQFDTRGDYYRPEQSNLNPTLAMVDARRGRILDSVSLAELERLTAAPRSARASSTAAVLPNGRLRVLMAARDWVLWTQGEAPRRIEKPYADGVATLTPDGAEVLMTNMLQAEGIICEHNPNCPPPTPEEGVWAALYDLRSGRVLWTVEGRAETFGAGTAAPVIRDDGRYAILQLPPGAEGQALALVDMRNGAILQRFPSVMSFGFTRGGRTLWLEYGGLLAFYALAR
jgi:hypothetical protein